MPKTMQRLPLSWLTFGGTALDFLEPALSSLDNWSAFICILNTQFGPIDPTADAEDSIDKLKMQHNQCILKYNIDFNRLAIQICWSDNVLQHWYYSGLAKQIKDGMGQKGKPANLPKMKTLVHAIDSCHCHRKSRSDKLAPNKDNKSQQKSEKKPKTTSSNSTKWNPSTSTSSNNNKLAKPSASLTSIFNKLGKDGKLSAE